MLQFCFTDTGTVVSCISATEAILKNTGKLAGTKPQQNAKKTCAYFLRYNIYRWVGARKPYPIALAMELVFLALTHMLWFTIEHPHFHKLKKYVVWRNVGFIDGNPGPIEILVTLKSDRGSINHTLHLIIADCVVPYICSIVAHTNLKIP